MAQTAARALSSRTLGLALGAPLCVLLLAGCGNPADTPAGTGGSGANGGSGSGGSGGSGAGGNGATSACASDAAPGEMVSVEAGSFVMGCNEEVDDACDDDELPPHEVSLSEFEIDVTEVTQDQYAACVTAEACPAPTCEWDCSLTDHPASCVNWAAAKSFCSWAGKRLPTEAEWERAARGDDGRKFPWGNDDADCSLANLAGCGDAAVPVGSFADGASQFGALDMAGNLVEMVADFYGATYYAESPTENPTGPASGERYGGRGGGFKSDADWLRVSKRDWYDADDSGTSLGFRCAR
jgi:formylglycine-generating enzyme required for sulfatase activity